MLKNNNKYFGGNRHFYKEPPVLFNDALNTFYLRLYGVRHDKGPPISSKGSLFYMHHPTDRIIHTSRGALAGTRNSSMGSP